MGPGLTASTTQEGPQRGLRGWSGDRVAGQLECGGPSAAGSARSTLARLKEGKTSSSPFSEKLTEHLREKLKVVREAFGRDRVEGWPDDAERIADVRQLQTLLRASEDPDHYSGEWWTRGAWLGSPARPLPRTPALHDRMTKWTLEDGGSALHDDGRTNHASPSEHEALALEQVDTEMVDGMMSTDLIVAATGATAEKGSDRTRGAWVIFVV